ncbi:Ribonuclease/ribotoxin [Dichomitus squalens]|uniref:Ribonuclease/ribotoxin n=1 Tax=Dichomitus squalens TaxID=114155 RepID=A0A4Q9N425_9APHY|nr:Ribonuclease/ribotoxin [Dichomitus squalens]
MKLLPIFALLSTVWVVSASPASHPNFANALIIDKAAVTCNCSGNVLSNGDIANALNRAQTLGGGDYPHTYNNLEGFTFPDCTKPFQEYPVFQGATYTGGKPGPDRVIYQTNGGQFCGCITHTNEGGNTFVKCT